MMQVRSKYSHEISFETERSVNIFLGFDFLSWLASVVRNEIIFCSLSLRISSSASCEFNFDSCSWQKFVSHAGTKNMLALGLFFKEK